MWNRSVFHEEELGLKAGVRGAGVIAWPQVEQNKHGARAEDIEGLIRGDLFLFELWRKQSRSEALKTEQTVCWPRRAIIELIV